MLRKKVRLIVDRVSTSPGRHAPRARGWAGLPAARVAGVAEILAAVPVPREVPARVGTDTSELPVLDRLLRPAVSAVAR